MNVSLEATLIESTNNLVYYCYNASKKAGWWNELDPEDKFIVATKLALIHSEISEALEAHRKNLMDDKLPNHKGITVELADAIIRIADLAGALKLPLGKALADKYYFNQTREDHKLENRQAVGGKAY